jgi:predicted nuclease of restriction endonuclease-like (RecB) superfamily
MKKVIAKNSKRLQLKEYAQVLVDIKKHIQEAQIKATFAANKELLKLYWYIGQIIAKQKKENGWGSSSVDQLAQDIQKAFPGIAGFSRSNIFRMQAFYTAYEKVARAVRQLEDLPILRIPWGHNILLLQKIKNNDERLWYATAAIENGWSKPILEMQIESDLYNRKGKAITNFSRTLPVPQSDMAQQSLKDPYMFDFLTLKEGHVEQDIELGLVENIQKTLLELGKGFAFIARQYHLEVDDQDYYIDLLFYHAKLKCYVVVELKNTAFIPEYAGKLNFYLSAVDDLLRTPGDQPTIGLLLCKSKKNFTAEYALRNIHSPIGVAEYQAEILKKLPKELKSSLPSIEEIEAELEKTEILEAEAGKNKRKTKKVNKKA